MTSSVYVHCPPGRHARRTTRGRVLLPLAAAVMAAAVVTAALVVFGAGRLTARNSTVGAAVPPPPAGMSLVFSDDFTGAANTGVNPVDWLYDVGTSYPGGAPNFGTGEVETMTNRTTNVYQDGAGHLAIRPVRDAAGGWTSGRIETRRTDFAAPPGGRVRFEASLQQPNVSGAAAAGYWPAFWSMGAAARPANATNWPAAGEWDVMEDVNGRGSQFATLHCGVTPGGQCYEPAGLSSGERGCRGCQTGFHRYTVELDRSISPEVMRWFVDGGQIFSVNASQVDTATWNNATHQGMFLILKVAIGGAFPAAFGGGPTADTRSGVPMVVDYVAVYRSAGVITSPTPRQQLSGRPTTGPQVSGPPIIAPPTAGSPTSAPPTPGPPADGGVGATPVFEAENFSAQLGARLETTTDFGGGLDVTGLADGDRLEYDDIDFGSTSPDTFTARVASGAAGGISGLVEVRLDNVANTPVGTFAVASTGGAQTWRDVPAGIAPPVTGVHTVFLTFTSAQPADFVNINRFTFQRRVPGG